MRWTFCRAITTSCGSERTNESDCVCVRVWVFIGLMSMGMSHTESDGGMAIAAYNG